MGRTLAVVLMLVVAAAPVGAQQALPPRVTDDGAPVLPADFAPESATAVDPMERLLLRLPRLPPGLPRPELRAREAMEVHDRAQERLQACRVAGADTRPCVQACAARWVVGPPQRRRMRSPEGYEACFAACFRAVLEHDAACLTEARAWQEQELRRRFGAGSSGP